MRLILLLLSLFSILKFLPIQGHSPTDLPPYYQRLASLYCYIDNYPAWLEEQSSLNSLLEFAQFFEIDTHSINEQLEHYRLQRECLRLIERLPMTIGPG